MEGKVVSEAVKARVRDRLQAAGGPPVCLATVLVGDDPPSRRYVASKQKQAAEVGMLSRHVGLPATASQDEVMAAVQALVDDASVHGILVQLPLPAGLHDHPVIDLIPAEKDVDGLTAASLGRLVRAEPGLVPATPTGCMRLLEHYGVATRGARAVVIGRSTLVGLPVALLLAAKGTDATVTIAHSRTPELAEVCRQADILVSAVGVARLVTAEHVKPGAAVLDVGISRTETGIVGDVEFDSVSEVAAFVTPMPGGTGIMTVACLLENTLKAAQLQGVL